MQALIIKITILANKIYLTCNDFKYSVISYKITVKTNKAMKTITPLVFLLIFTVSLTAQIVKQFEQRSFDLRDVQFIGDDTAIACGAPHWDQSSKDSIRTIIKTCDGGDTWNSLNVPLTETFNKIFFLDNETAWAAGQHGAMVMTTDGGENWTSINTGTTNEITGIFFISMTNGWIITTRPTEYDDFYDEYINWEGKVFYTNNGGSSWVSQPLPDSISVLNDIHFFNENTGIIIGRKFVGAPEFDNEFRGVILKTTDGGSTWQEHYRFLPTGSSNPDYNPTSIKFVDELHGWIAGALMNPSLDPGNIYYTADGGNTWTKQQLSFLSGISDFLRDIDFIDDLHGYAVGSDYSNPKIYRTMDGGATWDNFILSDILISGLLQSVTLNGSKMLAVSSNDLMVRTDTAWGSCGMPPVPFCTFLEADYINTHYSFTDIFFSDDKHGWAVGAKTYIPEFWGQVIFKTNDGGNNWFEQYQSAPSLEPGSVPFVGNYLLNKIFFVDSLKGWAVGCSRIGMDKKTAILYTEDGGNNWTEQGINLYDDIDLNCLSIDFTSETNGWALFASYMEDYELLLAHTVNGGADWNWANTGISNEILSTFGLNTGDVCFYDSLQGWVIGGKGVVAHTSDGGETWIDQPISFSSLSYHSVKFTSPAKGWITGGDLTVSQDGGNLWEGINIDKNYYGGYFEDCEFIDTDNGWVVGYSGIGENEIKGLILHTNDGGTTWMEAIDTSITSYLSGLFFVNDSIGWTAGGYGRIYKIYNNGIQYKELSGINSIENRVIVSNNLYNLKEYPLPCTDNLFIEFFLEDPKDIKLSIIDLTGKIILQLPEKKYQSGKQIIELNTRNFEKGIYVYCIKIGDHTLHRKFLKK